MFTRKLKVEGVTYDTASVGTAMPTAAALCTSVESAGHDGRMLRKIEKQFLTLFARNTTRGLSPFVYKLKSADL